MTTIFYRLAWKEYRQQRDLLFAIALITLVLLGIALAWAWVENRELSTDIAYHIALMMPVFYALGCAATLFAGEHERETFAFLRALPLRSRDVFWPKAMIAITSTLLLTAVLLLLAALFTRFRPVDAPKDLDLLGNYLLVMAEVLIWTMLFSQLLKHPFWAIAAGGVAYLASWLLIALCGTLLAQGLGLRNPGLDYSVFIAARCALALLVAVVNVALGTSWLQRDRVLTTTFAGPTTDEVVLAKGPATRGKMLGRLWWQSLRESGWIHLSIYGVLTLLTVLVAVEGGPIALVWTALPALVGSFAFFQDHWKQQYRFFAEHGVLPRTLWWARILASLSFCLPWLLNIIAVFALQTERPSGSIFSDTTIFQWPSDLIVLAIMCFAWGQWCSLVIPSGMVGLFVGVTFSIGTVFILAILRALGIPDWLGIYIPVAVLLWASWYRAPDWLAERYSWRRWLAYAATLAVPLVAYLAGMAAHRAYEIPQLVDNSSFVAGPGGVNIPVGIATQHAAALAELQRPATSEELETARLYRELWNELRQLPPPNTGGAMMMESMPPGGSAGSGPPGAVDQAGSAATADSPQSPAVDKEWEEKLARLVERFVEISRRPNADFFPNSFPQGAQVDEGPLDPVFERAAMADARRLDDAQEQEEALERYLALIRFARHYQQRGDAQQIYTAVRSLGKAYEQLLARAVRIKQSQESLLALIKTLNAAPYDFSPDYELAWMREYAWHRGLVELNPSAWEVFGTSPEVTTQRQLLAWLPWERTRAARWLDYWSVVRQLDRRSQSQAWDWQRNTLGASVIGIGQDSRESLDFLLKKQRAALKLRLLLLAYKAGDGELPPSLDELEREFPGQVQPDPTTQQAWIYRPQGDPAEQELQRPFIATPRVRNSGFIPFVSSAHRDFERYGEVFWIEPGTTDE
jgi:hypothetical protein